MEPPSESMKEESPDPFSEAYDKFINGMQCRNPGCNSLAILKSLQHELGMTFHVWQCPSCGWILERSEVNP